MDVMVYIYTYIITRMGHLVALRNVSFTSEQIFNRDGCGQGRECVTKMEQPAIGYIIMMIQSSHAYTQLDC